ncbi:heme peroxidase [Zychaea mexicana]|uniref:heme peroxidase n=1 Tax=Zychaea mexicana TaxID=64656 RepID=UPI0022FE3EB7|nr:heme peroxidase [Zychaea mexicana]KAI9479553.1 heme peroxidase [Zychaea mexicana]
MLSHQQIMSRRAPMPSTSSSSSSANGNNGAANNGKTDVQHQRALSQIQAIQTESGEAGLLRALQALVSNVREASAQGDDTKKNLKDILRKALGGQANTTNTDPFESTPSHEPEGINWTLGAIIKNLEAITGLNSTNTKAIKELLGLPLKQQFRLISAIVERLLGTHAPVNDRHNTFEATMKILGTMGPEQDELIYSLSQPLLEQFHNDIPKPYVNYVGHNFRTADGSYNSLLFPDVGRSGSNYVRTVTSKGPINAKLPEPSEVFNRLMKRKEFTPHKGGINMLFFYFAIIITHELFYTSPNNPRMNLTTSYADQSILYGFNRTDQESVRQMKDGLIKPDHWFDSRLVIQPPGVGAMLILFSRNHNYIAKTLLEKNEGGRFSYGPGKLLATEKDQDEELFQTARLINNACFFKVIEQEYARAILGVRQDAYFTLDVLGSPPTPMYGNAVSIEFNSTYRWHQALGEEDAAWADSVISTLAGPMRDWAMKNSGQLKQDPSTQANDETKGTDEGRFEALIPAFNEHFVHASPEELALGLPIAGIHRDMKTGQFSDFDLAKCLRRGYNQIACEVGNGLKVPASFEHIEIAGIIQSRLLRTCTFNEFRRYFNLTPLSSFEDFSEIPEVQKTLEELYGTPDQVELYTGVNVERCKVTGLRLPYTIGRAILADAINLIRNDRINVEEYTPTGLTNWGYEYSMSKKKGRIFPRMINQLLPHANANGQPAFSEEEMASFFSAPGHAPT